MDLPLLIEFCYSMANVNMGYVSRCVARLPGRQPWLVKKA